MVWFAFVFTGLVSLFMEWPRYQRVTIIGQSSDWLPILAGVPQGSILGPFLFLIYIIDLPDDLESLTKLFADGTSLFSKVYDSNLSNQATEQWSSENDCVGS